MLKVGSIEFLMEIAFSFPRIATAAVTTRHRSIVVHRSFTVEGSPIGSIYGSKVNFPML